MAFIPGYDHDVFVSYAHVDDQPFIDAAAGLERSSGWVSTLVRHLKNELAQKIGRSDAVSVWFDSNNLRSNHKLIDEIAARLERAAMFVAILSPGYIASQWCQDEAHMFARGCGGDPGRRLFVIEKAPLDNEPGPPAFTGRRAYRFWYSDRAEQPRTFAMPQPHADEIDYFRQIEDVARDLRDLCREMRRNQASAPVAVASATVQSRSDGSGVFLAEVTDDLEFRREEVRRYLEQQSVSVLPQLSFRRTCRVRSGARRRSREQPLVRTAARARAGKAPARRAGRLWVAPAPWSPAPRTADPAMAQPGFRPDQCGMAAPS
jgi:hypothetical protein